MLKTYQICPISVPKINKLRIIAFLLSIPIFKGLGIPERDIWDDEGYNELSKVRDIYSWAYLYSKEYVMNETFFLGDKRLPKPEKTCNNFYFIKEIPSKVLFKLK